MAESLSKEAGLEIRKFDKLFNNMTDSIRANQIAVMKSVDASRMEISNSKNILIGFTSQTELLKQQSRSLRENSKQLMNVVKEMKGAYQGVLEIATDPRSTPKNSKMATDLATELANRYASILPEIKKIRESIAENQADVAGVSGISEAQDARHGMVLNKYQTTIGDINKIFGVNFEEINERATQFTATLGTTKGKLIQVATAVVALGTIVGTVFKEWADKLGSVSQAAQMTGKTFQASFSALTSGHFFLSLRQSSEIAETLSEHMGGLNIPPEAIVEAGRLSSIFKISGVDAANLVGHLMRLTHGSAAVAKNVSEYTRALAATNNVPLREVFQDMATSSGIMARYSKENVKNFADAVVQARKLGTSIESISGVADKLISFDESIQAEMEASALLGKNLDLSAARQAAMKNDMTGVLREVSAQMGAMDFGKLNRVQQQALANAVGLSSEEISIMSGLVREGKSALTAADMSKSKDPILDKLGTLSTALGKLTTVMTAFLVVYGLKAAFGLGGGAGVSGLMNKLGIGAALGVGAGKLTGGEGEGSSSADALGGVASMAAIAGGPAIYRRMFGSKIAPSSMGGMSRGMKMGGAGLGAGLAGAGVSAMLGGGAGQNIGAGLGSTIGMIGGTALGTPIVGAIASAALGTVGGFIGSLFDDKKSGKWDPYGAESAPVSTPQMDTSGIERKIDELISVTRQSKNVSVNIDGRKASSFMNETKDRVLTK